ncbi:nuclear transport factor 2 family protein [Amycolatopsis pithecellobii]|uniref:Nuclear transport factor 2 family protein n=1 Tax=Amycolatopsis pithecellobii TaxID=664692 RepID=A0A6N7Z9E2_9PSEU|nr:nuclear transport factor 2 family protein [Amycolatopsis pithecellobii]MTD58357.1 nuclear transport factor 2 family protein [Amycolatopsis pithecellobii]
MTEKFPPHIGNEKHCEILRYVYADLERIAEAASDDIVLHPADHSDPRVGVKEVLAHEQGLIAATGGTLVMDVTQIATSDHFGAVLGILRATSPETVAMPFCGLWRFENGKLVEHWENAFDAAELGRALGAAAPAGQQ